MNEIVTPLIAPVTPPLPSVSDVGTLLGEYTDRVNQHGASSAEAKEFLGQHADNPEFLSLAAGVVFLRRKFDSFRAEAAGLVTTEPRPAPDPVAVPHETR